MKTKDFGIALFIIIILSAAATGLCQDSAEEYIRRGKELFENKQYLEALASLVDYTEDVWTNRLPRTASFCTVPYIGWPWQRDILRPD